MCIRDSIYTLYIINLPSTSIHKFAKHCTDRSRNLPEDRLSTCAESLVLEDDGVIKYKCYTKTSEVTQVLTYLWQ